MAAVPVVSPVTVRATATAVSSSAWAFVAFSRSATVPVIVATLFASTLPSVLPSRVFRSDASAVAVTSIVSATAGAVSRLAWLVSDVAVSRLATVPVIVWTLVASILPAVLTSSALRSEATAVVSRSVTASSPRQLMLPKVF